VLRAQEGSAHTAAHQLYLTLAEEKSMLETSHPGFYFYLNIQMKSQNQAF